MPLTGYISPKISTLYSRRPCAKLAQRAFDVSRITLFEAQLDNMGDKCGWE